uniref:CCHC-type domain-containing protein n=1 Tax=Pygocentrus nattereri TaxID=42514 RepID=A0AAR2JRA6_PYGNA
METFFQVVETLIEKSAKPSYDSHVFRRLRAFSGLVPTPAGEESLDIWLEQARLMVDEAELPDREKRKRILESLKGPAFDIAQAVRANDPDATPDDYIAALEKHFGEKLSDFLRRIERTLTKVVQKGGLLPTQRDGARIEQLLRGATESELMLVQLRIRERRHCPPRFLELLNEVREEEDRQLVRRKTTLGTAKATVRRFSATEDMLASPSETVKLQNEIEQQGRDATARFPSSARRDPQERCTEMRRKETFFCYRCGEDGHVSRRCVAAQDSSKVISKLISALRRQRHNESSPKRKAHKKEQPYLRKSEPF